MQSEDWVLLSGTLIEEVPERFAAHYFPAGPQNNQDNGGKEVTGAHQAAAVLTLS